MTGAHDDQIARSSASGPDDGSRPPPADARRVRVEAGHRERLRARALRITAVFGALALCFTGVAAQLVRLAASGQTVATTSISRPLSQTFSRPDIVDRNGVLLAGDVVMQSLFADPSKVRHVDEALEALRPVLPGLDWPRLRKTLSNAKRRFAWIKRGLSPATARRIHELGLPGFAFRAEPKRGYPQGRVAGHIIGHVNIDNVGGSGIERYIDEHVGIQRVVGEPEHAGSQVRLTIDLPVQAALEEELARAVTRYACVGATGVIIDARTGAVRAAASLPSVNPALALEAQDERYLDRLSRATYELGSIFKVVTIAMALERRTVTLETMFDVTSPLKVGRHTIRDLHPAGKALSVSDIFIRSSNVGAGMIALEVGGEAQRTFLEKLGLLESMTSEAGAISPPQVPKRWGKAETVTVSYGHGLAVAPLQFAAAGAALINGGRVIRPNFVESQATKEASGRVVSQQTSTAMRQLMRANVVSPRGSGRRAHVAGYDVGGKTGTADLAANGAYDGRAVVTSFFAAFPMVAPEFVVLVTLHDPKGQRGKDGGRKERTAGLNAAPTAGRVIARAAPLLGVFPKDR